jgi:chlorite dismutase
MTHDPLCDAFEVSNAQYCDCEFIATVREDMLHKCIAVVESMRQAQSSTWTHGEYLSRRSVLAALLELKT